MIFFKGVENIINNHTRYLVITILVKLDIIFIVIEICEPCRQRRLDEEKREQLKYSKAKIFIKVVEKEGRENNIKYNGIDEKVK